MIRSSTTQQGNKMKLISIHASCGHTSVIVERSDIEYCIEISSYDDERNAVYENLTGKKIRKNSNRHEMFCFFAKSKLNQATTA
jgi:hypothetical protein